MSRQIDVNEYAFELMVCSRRPSSHTTNIKIEITVTKINRSMSLSDFVFRRGDLPDEILDRGAVQLFPTSNYWISLTWSCQNLNYHKSRQFVTPGRISEACFRDLLNVVLHKKHFSNLDKKNICRIVKMMYLVKYKYSKNMLAKLSPTKYSTELAEIVEPFDPNKAAEIIDHLDWNTPLKKEYLLTCDKSTLIELILKMAQMRKKRKLSTTRLESSPG